MLFQTIKSSKLARNTNLPLNSLEKLLFVTTKNYKIKSVTPVTPKKKPLEILKFQGVDMAEDMGLEPTGLLHLT